MAVIFGDLLNGRSGFARLVAEATHMCRSVLARLPREEELKSVLAQLEAVHAWTADGQTPTPEQRASLDMGVRMMRGYEDTDDDEIHELRRRVSPVHSYIRYWPTDAQASDPDNDRNL